MTSQNLSNRVPNAWSRPFALAEGTRDPFILTIITLSATYTACGCGHGGTRNSSTSLKVHTCSVNPAAMAGVRGCQCLAVPLPLVGSGCGSAWRRLAWGKQKL